MGKIMFPPGVILVEDRIDHECIRHVHMISNTEIGTDWLMQSYAPHVHGSVKVEKEAGVWHLRAEWPFKGALSIEAEGWPQAKRMVAWSFEGCVNVTEALMQASVCYEHTFGCKPQYGFLKSLPRGVENGRETGPLLVFSAEWMLEKAVAVGG